MSKTLNECRVILSQELGDYWAGTTTSAGSAGGTTVVDTALMSKTDDWITEDTQNLITSGTYSGEERLVTALDSTTGAITTKPHTGQVVSGTSYEIHRLFTASEKRRAIIAATKQSFPHLYQEVWDNSLVNGNWLVNGSFEDWSDINTLVTWGVSVVTTTQETALMYKKHSLSSCKLNTTSGSIYEDMTKLIDIKSLANKSVTFTLQGWCDTPNCLRIGVYDGTTTTYSDYHPGDSTWTEDKYPLKVIATIPTNPTSLSFIIYHDIAAGTSRVDDARVISDVYSPQYIGYLWLSQNQPVSVEIEPTYYSRQFPLVKVRDYEVDPDGYLWIPTNYSSDRRLVIKGRGYLDFLTSGVASTNWAATIALDEPQIRIIVAEAALYLYRQMSLPNFETGTRKEYQEMLDFWKQEVAERKAKYGMYGRAGATVHYGIS